MKTVNAVYAALIDALREASKLKHPGDRRRVRRRIKKAIRQVKRLPYRGKRPDK